MKPFPHLYTVMASAEPDGEIALASNGLQTLKSMPPAEFDGPGDHWSPETLLVGAVADCFILTFRAVARSAKLPWTSISCSVEGVLERVQGNSSFTGFTSHVHLLVPTGTDLELADRSLHKAELGCLISNSLKAHNTLQIRLEEAG